MNNKPTPQEIAKAVGAWFVAGERPDGTKFRKTRDGVPGVVVRLIREAHGDMLPDDHKYEGVENALSAIANTDDVRDMDETASEFADAVDCYNADLLRWVSSHLTRAAYVDQAVDDYGWPGDFYTALQYGQSYELREIFDSVWRFVEEWADDIEGEDVERREEWAACVARLVASILDAPEAVS